MTNRPTRARRRHTGWPSPPPRPWSSPPAGAATPRTTPTTTRPARPSPTATAETPEGVELTEPGTQLDYGDSAVVDFKLRKQATLLDLKVKNAVQGVPQGLRRLRHVGPVPEEGQLLLRQGQGRERRRGRDRRRRRPAVGDHRGQHAPAAGEVHLLLHQVPHRATAQEVQAGETHDTCLVFLSPNKGTLEGVSYRPVESFDPIEWRGQVEAPVTTTKQSEEVGRRRAQEVRQRLTAWATAACRRRRGPRSAPEQLRRGGLPRRGRG